MSSRIGTDVEQSWGDLEVLPEEPSVVEWYRTRLHGLSFSVTRYRWLPPSEWGEELRGECALTLRCLQGECGRRFYPVASVEDYLATAFACGLAALTQAFGLSGEQRSSYGAQWLLFQRLLATREHLKNHLGNPASLRVRRSGRSLEARNSILPESVGCNSSGQGRPWTLDHLLDEGRREAHGQGFAKPDRKQCVRYGFLRAARLNPLHIQPNEVPALMRMALYVSPEGETVDDKTVGQVVERALEAIESHLADEMDHFSRWLQGRKNSFIGQIAKRKLASGGALKRSVTRRVLFDQGWLAYQHVADCVHTTLYLFRRLLSSPLNDCENRAFERLHLKQDYFGGLPALMLAERFLQLQPILNNVWEDKDNSEAVAIMHRLLDYYSEMAAARRPVDRVAKARKKGDNKTGACYSRCGATGPS